MNIKLKKEGGVNVKLKKEGGFFIAVIRYNMHFDHNVIFNKFIVKRSLLCLNIVHLKITQLL